MSTAEEVLDITPHLLLRHTQWSLKWLKKYPSTLNINVLTKCLVIPNGKRHPVLDALGGEAWLKTILARKETPLKEEQRRGRSCWQCGAQEYMMPLFRCAKCQTVYYWCVRSTPGSQMAIQAFVTQLERMSEGSLESSQVSLTQTLPVSPCLSLCYAGRRASE